MRKLLERVPEVSVEKSKAEKFDEGRRGGAEPKVSEADAKRDPDAGSRMLQFAVLRMLQCVSEDEDELPSEEFLKGIGVTKEEWSKMMRALRADEPHDDDLKGLGMSKEDVFSNAYHTKQMQLFILVH